MASGNRHDGRSHRGQSAQTERFVDALRQIYTGRSTASYLISASNELWFLGSADEPGQGKRPPKAVETYLLDALKEATPGTETIEAAPRGYGNQSYEIQLTPTLGPDNTPWRIAHLRQRRRPNLSAQLSLTEELSRQTVAETSIDDAGQYLTDRLHHHLGVCAIATWGKTTEDRWRWQSGDPDILEVLQHPSPSSVRRRTDSIDSATAVRNLTDDAELPITEIHLRSSQEQSLVIRLARTDDLLELDIEFWEFFGAMARSFIQSAHLFQAHRRERRRLRAVIESMPMAVVLYDDQGEIYDWNTRAQMITGRREWRHVGSSNHPFIICDIEGNPLPKAKWPFIRALQTGVGFEEEVFVLDFGDRTRTVAISIIPISDREGEPPSSFLATGRDVTQRTEAERRKDEFLSVASHELRSPLTPLAGFIQMSRKQASANKRVDPDVLRRAESQVKRLQRLIDGLLDVTRLETGKLPIRRRETDLTALVQRVMAPWNQGPLSDRIAVGLPEDPVMAAVDPDRIDQVLTNLVSNALEHGCDDGMVAVTLRDDGERAILEVQDEGHGIPREIIDRVFDRFFHAHQTNTSGTGIGLYISRQIVEDHGGTISIDSGRDQPTTVTVCLPRGT